MKEWQGPKLSEHMSPWPKTATLGNKSPLLSSVLAGKFEAEPEPATHFSNLSNSRCLHNRCYLTPETHNSFLTALPHALLYFTLETSLSGT